MGFRKLAAAVAVVAIAAGACGGGASSPSAAPASSPPTAATSAATTTAPVASASTAAELPAFWYINVLTSYDLYNQSQKLFVDSADKIGYKAFTAGSPKVDIPGQITLIQQAIAQGAKAILYCDLDPATYDKTIKDAQAKGIVMVTTGGCVDTTSDYSVGTDNAAFGATAADTLAKQVGPTAKVVVFSTNASVPNQVAILNGFKAQAAKNYPNLKILSVQYDNADPAQAATMMAAALTAYPDVQAFWFIEGAGPSAAPKTLEQAGKKPGDIFVLGVDATPEALTSIQNGWISSVLAQCFFYATPFASQLALKKLNGQGPTQQSWNVGVVPVGKADLPFAGCPASAYPSIP